MTDHQDPAQTPSPGDGQPADAHGPAGNHPPADDLAARLTALEEQVSSLVAALGTEPGTAARAPDLADPLPGDTSAGAQPTSGSARGSTGAQPTAGGVDPFWALNGLKDTLGDLGGVVFAGYLRKPDGRRADWQYGRTAAHIEAADFADSAAALAALASPVRLALIQAVYDGAHSVADLVESGDFGTTGQIYHHVNQLAAAGWLESPRRGRWTVPVERIIPLLTIILATQG
ncbi:winged helix-turn-helix domain-containing protein [Brevibacterium sp. NPDC049920]|uniref:HTH arsR-type domain-containing protein n=2 Tax=Brevibacterium TaxID=1696 RepID=A0ABP8J0R9_9MICO